ncbi:MAG: efflux RND transporter periplasmic adaptor subunit [Planctomycetota bacterium]|nr:efflux RND transporter periplasmic adaptor subunit [Planctomycetota bacterium]
MRMIQLFTRTLAISLSVSLLLVGCDGPPEEEKTSVRPVKIHTIGSLEPAAMREYPGTIRAYQTAEMGFEVAGRVTEFLVKEGDVIKKGMVLARLDSRDYVSEEKVARANLAKSQADLARSENIYKEDRGAISADDIERDKRAVAVTQAQLEIAEKAVADTELRAPFAGVMARKLVEDFANVQAKEPVLILQDNSILEIEVAVPERDFIRRHSQSETKEAMTKRLNPKVVVSSLPNREFSARIKEYATKADSVTRTFPVKLNFDNPPDVNILPGMTSRVQIVIDPQSAWSVPSTAAQADENEQPYVWKVDPDSMKVSRVPVELGPLTGSRVLLRGGVKNGEMIVTSGVMLLREGIQVRKIEN